MGDLKKTPLIDLANRLNQIRVEKRDLDLKHLKLDLEGIKLDTEYNEIIYELWKRIPTLKDCPDIQPKTIQKKIGGLVDGTKNNSSN